jgi:hypothetical protein
MSLRDGGFPSKQSPARLGDCFACSFAIAQDKARNDMQRIKTERAIVHGNRELIRFVLREGIERF